MTEPTRSERVLRWALRCGEDPNRVGPLARLFQRLTGWGVYSSMWPVGRALWVWRLAREHSLAERFGCTHPIGWRSTGYPSGPDRCLRCGLYNVEVRR